jgi:hypothetical protein
MGWHGHDMGSQDSSMARHGVGVVGVVGVGLCPEVHPMCSGVVQCVLVLLSSGLILLDWNVAMRDHSRA